MQDDDYIDGDCDVDLGVGVSDELSGSSRLSVTRVKSSAVEIDNYCDESFSGREKVESGSLVPVPV
jgi:hypothetical protein